MFPTCKIVNSPFPSQTISVNPSQINRYSLFKDHVANPEAMEAVKQTVAQNLGVGGAHKMVPDDQRFDLNDTPDQKGKVAVITGGSEGLGYGALYTLLKFGLEKAFVISVDQTKIDEALKAISKDLGDETAKKVTWLQCDLADWKATKETADKISKSTDRIDILLNNAARGMMTYQLTDYGVDRHVSLRSISSLPPLPCSHH